MIQNFAICMFVVMLLVGVFTIPANRVSGEPHDSPLFVQSLENSKKVLDGESAAYPKNSGHDVYSQPAQTGPGVLTSWMVTCQQTCAYYSTCTFPCTFPTFGAICTMWDVCLSAVQPEIGGQVSGIGYQGFKPVIREAGPQGP